jgi:hypothetical protein
MKPPYLPLACPILVDRSLLTDSDSVEHFAGFASGIQTSSVSAESLAPCADAGESALSFAHSGYCSAATDLNSCSRGELSSRSMAFSIDWGQDVS